MGASAKAISVDGRGAPLPAWVTVPHRVIYGDTDAMGIVYYGNYLRYLEIGRNAYFRACGAEYGRVERDGFQLPVAEVSVRYRSPARFDDDIEIATRVEHVGGARVRFAYRLTRARDGVLLAEGVTVHACVHKHSGRPTRLPRELARCLLSQAREDALT